VPSAFDGPEGGTHGDNLRLNVPRGQPNPREVFRR
jgi:hypothetical protein